MPRQTAAGPVDGQPYRVMLLAQKSSALDVLTRQLEQLNCAVECAETVVEAQSMMADGTPHFAFIECLQFPMRVAEIVELFHDSSDTRPGRPRLVGIGCEHCPSGDPGACGMDDYLRLPPQLNDLEGLLALQHPDGQAAQGGVNAHLPGCRELSVSDAMSQLPEDVQTAMLTAFVEYTASRFARIEAGLNERDFKQVARDVHAVKSGCLQMGFSAMVECCEELRRAVDGNDIGAAQRCFRALVVALDDIVGALPRS